MTRWLALAEEHSATRHNRETDKTDETRPITSDIAGVVSVSSVSRLRQSVRRTQKNAGLPTEPNTCAVCGVADWRVSLTVMDGRNMHVGCWKAGET